MNYSAWSPDQLDALTTAKEMGLYNHSPLDNEGEYASGTRDPWVECEALLSDYSELTGAERHNRSLLLSLVLEKLLEGGTEDERLSLHIAASDLMDELADFSDPTTLPTAHHGGDGEGGELDWGWVENLMASIAEEDKRNQQR